MFQKLIYFFILTMALRYGHVELMRNPKWQLSQKELLKSEMANDDPDDLVVRVCFICSVGTDNSYCSTKNCEGDVRRIM